MKKCSVLWTIVFFLFLPVTAPAGNALPSELAAAIKDAGFNYDGIGLYIQAVDDAEPVVSFQAD